jgi:hypothetical protein
MMREQSLQLMHMTKVVSRLANRKLALGFGGWAAAVAPREDSTSKALLYFVNREMARGWVSWHTRWAVLSARRESMRKSVGYLLKRELSQAWGAWVEMSAERAEVIRTLRKGASFIMSRALALGFAGWRASNASCDDPMPRALSYLISRELVRGWNSWAEVAKIGRDRHALLRGLSHLPNLKLARGWRTWVERAVEGAEVLRKLRKGARFVINRHVAVAFAGWLFATEGAKLRAAQARQRLKVMVTKKLFPSVHCNLGIK